MTQPPDIVIRPERAGDEDAVRALVNAAFARKTHESRNTFRFREEFGTEAT
jgi:hypothetical protein